MPSNPIDVKLGANIRQRRTLLGLSQEALGQALPKPVTFQQIQKYERGVNRVSGSMMLYIAQALKCSVADLYVDVEGANAAPESTRAELEFMRLYQQLPPAMQVSVKGFMSDIIASKPTMEWGARQ